MKPISRLICLSLLGCTVFSCAKKFVDKPEPLLSEETMIDIYYEIALLNSLRTITPAELQKAEIQTMPYIYRKFDIDSLTLTRNTNYYVSQPDVFSSIYDSVLTRVRRNSARVDTLRTRSEQQLDSSTVNRQPETMPAQKGSGR